MADFKKYYPLLQNHEGGYADNPNDDGGETYAGVARNFWPRWPGWKRIDPIVQGLKKRYVTGWPEAGKARIINSWLKKDTILQDMIFQFYKVNFWNSLQLDFVKSQPVAEQLADLGVNAGPMRPAKMVQRLVNQYFQRPGEKPVLVVDGDIGPGTINHLNQVPAALLYAQFVAMRKEFYYYRVGQLEKVNSNSQRFFADELNLKVNPKKIEFLKSWLSRCVPATISTT